MLLQLLLYIVKIGGVSQWLTLLTSVGCVHNVVLLLACLFHGRRFELRLSSVLKERLVWGLRSLSDLLR